MRDFRKQVPCMFGESSAEPLEPMRRRGRDSLTVGIVSAAPSISDVSASPNLPLGKTTLEKIVVHHSRGRERASTSLHNFRLGILLSVRR